MAIAITEPVAELIATTDASSYSLGAFTPTANSLLIVFASVPGTATSQVITGGSLTWNILIGRPANCFFCFWAQVGASPVSTTITTTPNTSGTGIGICVFQVTGHDTTGVSPFRQTRYNGNTGINAKATFESAANTNNGCVGAWGGGLAAGSSTPPTGWTETSDGAFTVPTANFSSAFRNSGETGTTINFTSATTTWVCILVEIFVAGASPLRRHLGTLGAG